MQNRAVWSLVMDVGSSRGFLVMQVTSGAGAQLAQAYSP